MIVRRRRLAVMFLSGGALLLGACNAIIGAPERVLDDEEDASETPDRRPGKPDGSDPLDPPDARSDGGTDAAPIEITVGADWDSPNGAKWVVDGGTRITSFGATHAVLVPKKQPLIPAEDYTVFAVIRAPKDGEFGILTRVQADRSGVLIASKFGAESRPFMGNLRPPDWNPTDDGRGVAYTFVPGARYHFKLRATGAQVAGKMWRSTEPEPGAYQVMVTAPWSTGRGVGFYSYGVNDAVLELMKITVP